MADNKENIDNIKSKISLLISQCEDTQIYSDIMSDIFKYKLEKELKSIDKLNILPKLNAQELKNNFKKNIYKIISFIKIIINSAGLDIYRALSCIFGAFLGDAMGAFCEFEKPSKKNSKTIFNSNQTVIGGVRGQVTDDSEMAISLAFAIMDINKKDELISDYIYFYYGAWIKTNPLDLGKTTHNALKDFNFNIHHPHLNKFKDIENQIKENNKDSLSNGFLMRKSPFIVWLYYRFFNEITLAFETLSNNDNLLKLYEKIKNLSNADNKCTNPNPETNVASSIYCLMALMAIKGLSSNVIIHKIENLCKEPLFISKGNEEKNIGTRIIDYIKLFKYPNFELFNSYKDMKNNENVYKKMGYYMHAFKLTLYFLCNFDNIEKTHPEKKYREIMNQICDLGGDTDTNCCIVGAVIGPLIGMSNFGKHLTEMFELIPPNRSIYSVALVVLFIIYLKKSNSDNKYIENNKYFLEQILTMLYGDIELDY